MVILFKNVYINQKKEENYRKVLFIKTAFQCMENLLQMVKLFENWYEGMGGGSSGHVESENAFVMIFDSRFLLVYLIFSRTQKWFLGNTCVYKKEV